MGKGTKALHRFEVIDGGLTVRAQRRERLLDRFEKAVRVAAILAAYGLIFAACALYGFHIRMALGHVPLWSVLLACLPATWSMSLVEGAAAGAATYAREDVEEMLEVVERWRARMRCARRSRVRAK